jgi:hypothetical protein
MMPATIAAVAPRPTLHIVRGAGQVARVDGSIGDQGRSKIVVRGSSLPTDATLWGGLFYIY